VKLVNQQFGAKFNGVLVNYYPDGDHYISDHSDSEKGLDKACGVVIISYGATRTMQFKRTKSPPVGTAHFRGGFLPVPLVSGSVIAMQQPQFQSAYTHGIPVEKTAIGGRWSFTFRCHGNVDEGPMIAAAIKTQARIADKLAKRGARAGAMPPPTTTKRAKLE